MKIRSIRFKTSVLFSGFLFLVLSGFGVYQFYTVRQFLYEDKQEEILARFNHIDHFIDSYAQASAGSQTSASLLHQLFALNQSSNKDKEIISRLWVEDSRALGLQNDYYRFLTLQGKVLLGSNNMTPQVERSFNDQFSPQKGASPYRILRVDKKPLIGISGQIDCAGRNRLILQIATPMTSVGKILAKLGRSLTAKVLIIILFTVFMGAYLTRTILKPVNDVIVTANEISQKNLNRRIPLEEMDEELENLVKSFNRMIERLGSSFTYINEFNSHLAHEMKTPLAIIKGELELALDANELKDEERQLLQSMLQEINRLIKIIKDMLLLAKYEYKVDVFKMEKMDLTPFLKEIYEQSKLLALEKKIKVESFLENGPLWISGDATHLRRVFLNLMNNAIKFTPGGGTVQLVTQAQGQRVEVAVKDSGIGIAQENQARIFEKFYRVRSPDQEFMEGNGLGLSMAKAIVRAHEGDISFESTLRHGSTFKVSLPRLWD